MAELQQKLIPPDRPRSILGVLICVVFFVISASLISSRAHSGDIQFWIFEVVVLTVSITLFVLFSFPYLLVRNSWFIGIDRIDWRRRIFIRTRNSTFTSIRNFELVHGIWTSGEGSTDRLQFRAQEQYKPVVIDATATHANGRKYQSGFNYGNKAGSDGQWSLKLQGFPPSSISPLSKNNLPNDPLARIVDENLLALGVFLAKELQRPLLFSQQIVEGPTKGD
jgi:hypothetical protein